MKKLQLLPFDVCVERSCANCRVNGFISIRKELLCPVCGGHLAMPDRTWPQTFDVGWLLRRFSPQAAASGGARELAKRHAPSGLRTKGSPSSSL